jgi:histidinol-phosphate aminotransferase
VDLRDNVNLWGAPPHAVAALQQAAAETLTQYPRVSGGALAPCIANSCGVDANEVAVGCGSDDLIDSACRAFAEPGMRLAHPAPSFSMVPIFARLNGLEPVAIPLTPDGSADADAMLAARARIIYVCSPNNPTGTVTPAEMVNRLLQESDSLVILDGAYAEFAPELADFLTEAPSRERLLVLRTLSKAWGLAGLRVGYAVGAAELIRALRQANGPYKVNALAERAACTALTADADWMRQHAAAAVACRDQVAAELRTLGLTPLRSHGNFVSVPVSDSRALAARIAARGVAVRAFTNLPVYGDLIRVGVGPWPLMEQLLRAVRGALAS